MLSKASCCGGSDISRRRRCAAAGASSRRPARRPAALVVELARLATAPVIPGLGAAVLCPAGACVLQALAWRL